VFDSESNNLFVKRGLKFNSSDPEIVTIFQDYDYTTLDVVNPEIIDPFLKHIHDVIASSEEELYHYVID
jgi:hypothetical protein